jgi:hypothetical protein
MEQPRALIVVNDETVLDEVLRLAAAVGCVVERAADLPSARGLWGRAPLVVIDEASRAQWRQLASQERSGTRRQGVAKGVDLGVGVLRRR